MSFGNFLKLHGINYTLQRQNKPVREERGLPDKGYIMFRPGTDIVKSDVLTNPVGETYYVVRAETEFAYGKPHFLKVFYQTEREYSAAEQSSQPIFNIQNAYGSVIGTGNQATVNYNSAVSELRQAVASDTSADKEQLEKSLICWKWLSMTKSHRLKVCSRSFAKSWSEILGLLALLRML